MTDDVRALLRDHQRYLLTTHLRPDGDAIGSELALARFLEKQGKTVTILNTDPPPYTLEWMPGAERLQVFDGAFEQRKALAETDVVVVMDTNAEHRLGDDLGPSIRQSGAKKLLIDHHTDPETWFDATYQRDTSAAAGELVYELIMDLDPSLFDAEIATALYAAIMTDTGSFRYSSVTPRLHRVIADILERGGIEPAPIHTALFDNRSLASLRLLGLALDKIELRYDGKVGYTIVTHDMLQATGADSDDKKGLVSYVLSVEGVEAALIFSEAGGGTKVSFRSTGDTYVNKWASAFGGGGHRNASGAYVKKSMPETIAAVLDAAPRFIDVAAEAQEALSDEDAASLASMMRSRN